MSIEGSSGVPATALEAGTPEIEAVATPQPAVAKETITPRDLSRARKQAKQIEELNAKVVELTGSLNRVENQQAENAMHVEAHLRDTEAQVAQVHTQIAQLQAQVSQLEARRKPAAKKPAKKSSPATKSAKKKKKKAAKKKR